MEEKMGLWFLIGCTIFAALATTFVQIRIRWLAYHAQYLETKKHEELARKQMQLPLAEEDPSEDGR